jgi:hypothetical protein
MAIYDGYYGGEPMTTTYSIVEARNQFAAVNNLILVTRNTADFAHFAGLRLENWFESAA